VALDRGSPARGEQPEPLVEPLRDLGRVQRRDAGGRELEGKGNAVEAATDGHHAVGVLRSQVEVAADRCRPLDEELHRVTRTQGVERRVLGRHRERRDGKEPFTGEREPFTAGCEHDDPGAVPDDVAGEFCNPVEDVLAVVEHQEE
jgi:hypothetical protein